MKQLHRLAEKLKVLSRHIKLPNWMLGGSWCHKYVPPCLFFLFVKNWFKNCISYGKAILHVSFSVMTHLCQTWATRNQTVAWSGQLIPTLWENSQPACVCRSRSFHQLSLQKGKGEEQWHPSGSTLPFVSLQLAMSPLGMQRTVKHRPQQSLAASVCRQSEIMHFCWKNGTIVVRCKTSV